MLESVNFLRQKILSQKILLILVLLTSSTVMAGIPALANDRGEAYSLSPMLKMTMPGVVNIATKSRVQVPSNPLFNDPFFRRFFDVPSQPRHRESQSLGSGVIVDADKGFVVTNNHVIEGADEISVKLRDGRSMLAKVIGRDPDADLAVIQIKADKLHALAFADSDRLEVGDFVVAIGNPFGLEQTVTSGIVSALGRSGLGIEGFEDFIQTDASINPGNSGGALVNLKGELVGINTAIVGPAGGNVGIGFAIPSNMTKTIMQQLIEHGEVRRGQLGVVVQDLSPELVNAFNLSSHKGVVVAQVAADSAADKAGLKTGDVIVAINGKTVDSSSGLRNLLGLQPVGTQIELNILRDGSKRKLQARIVAPKQTKVAGGRFHKSLEGALLGFKDASQFSRDEPAGVSVLSVAGNSPAWRTGLRQGDMIMLVNRRQVFSDDDFKAAVKASRRGLVLNILRGDSAFFIVIR